MADRHGWIFLQSDLLRQRDWRQGRLFRDTRGRHRATDRLHLSDQRALSGLYQSQGVRGICRGTPGRRLEYMAHVRNLTDSPERGACNRTDGTQVKVRVVPQCREARNESRATDGNLQADVRSIP